MGVLPVVRPHVLRPPARTAQIRMAVLCMEANVNLECPARCAPPRATGLRVGCGSSFVGKNAEAECQVLRFWGATRTQTAPFYVRGGRCART